MTGDARRDREHPTDRTTNRTADSTTTARREEPR